MGGVVAQLAFPVPNKEYGIHALQQRRDRITLQTANDQSIVAIYIRKNSGRTILYSHGNAEDLGQILPYIDRMAETCAADVLAYDYCGYSLSTGEPSEENCYFSINAAYEFLRKPGSSSAKNPIIAFGRSIGSGPTVDLVSRHPEINAMVLQSPIESAGRAVGNQTISYIGYRLDLFKNYEKAPLIKCKVFVMHGTADEVVPFRNGQAIQEACVGAVEPYWVRGRGHNDMPENDCLRKIREFVDNYERLPPAAQHGAHR